MHRMNHMAGWARDVTVWFVFGVVSEERPCSRFASVPRGFSRQLINELSPGPTWVAGLEVSVRLF